MSPRMLYDMYHVMLYDMQHVICFICHVNYIIWHVTYIIWLLTFNVTWRLTCNLLWHGVIANMSQIWLKYLYGRGIKLCNKNMTKLYDKWLCQINFEHIFVYHTSKASNNIYKYDQRKIWQTIFTLCHTYTYLLVLQCTISDLLNSLL